MKLKYEEIILEIKYVKFKAIPTPQNPQINTLQTKNITTYKLLL